MGKQEEEKRELGLVCKIKKIVLKYDKIIKELILSHPLFRPAVFGFALGHPSSVGNELRPVLWPSGPISFCLGSLTHFVSLLL